MTKRFGVLLVAGALSLALAAGGCSKDEETNPLVPGGGTTGSGTCKINGTSASIIFAVALIDTSTLDGAGGIAFGGVAVAGGDSSLLVMTIGTSNPANGSTFTLSDNNVGTLYNSGAYYTTNANSTGALAIGTNSATSITATFNFNAAQVEGTGTRSLTEGSGNFLKAYGGRADAAAVRERLLALRR